MSEATVLTCRELAEGALELLFRAYGLRVEWIGDGAEIPGSHWGAPEAGLLGDRLLVRQDTPVHSALHEGCHWLCMDDARREILDTDAGGDDTEECGVCLLQILLADSLPGVGRDRLCRDMDAWGYSFRLGSTRAWFEEDAEDGRQWLLREGLIDGQGRPTGRRRGQRVSEGPEGPRTRSSP